MKDIRNDLIELKEDKLSQFNKKLCPDTDYEILGIRVPILRKYAKELVLEYDLDEILSHIQDKYLEEILLQGFVIGYSKKSLNEKIKYIEKFILKIDSWIISDTFVPTLKIKNKDKEFFWEFIQKYINSDKEFEIRFAIIVMLDYYLAEEYVEKVLEILDKINNDGYYVKMAVAWTIAEINIKFSKIGMEYLLEKNHLDKFTYNKTLQKMIESYRIPLEKKDKLREMKRK